MSQIDIIACIRDNATGEVVSDPSSCNTHEDGTPNPSWWEHGNASCDCNRKQFFLEAKGEYPEDLNDDDENQLCPCGRTAFSVNLSTPDGNVFYREFEEAK